MTKVLYYGCKDTFHTYFSTRLSEKALLSEINDAAKQLAKTANVPLKQVKVFVGLVDEDDDSYGVLFVSTDRPSTPDEISNNLHQKTKYQERALKIQEQRLEAARKLLREAGELK